MVSASASLGGKTALTIKTDGKTLDFILGELFKDKNLNLGVLDISTLKISVSSE